MSMPWKRPEPPANFTLGDHAGEVVLVILGGYHPAVPTRQYGEKPAARVTVVLLTGRHAGTVHTDVMLFGQPGSQFINEQPGNLVLGRVAKRDKTVTLDDYSTYDEQVAMAWTAQNGPALDVMRTEAVRNFREQAAKMAVKASQPVAPAQQFQPPQAPVQAATGNGGSDGQDITPGQAYGSPGPTLGSMGGQNVTTSDAPF